MGFQKVNTGQIPRPADSAVIVAMYERRRPLRLRMNHELVSRLSRETLDEGARKLGFLKNGILVLESEDESAVLMDYSIYNVYPDGRNAVAQYVLDYPPMPVDSDDAVCLRAMQQQTYAGLEVLGIETGVGCYVQKMFTDAQHLLVDLNLSRTAVRGAAFITRLLDFGEYTTTGGAMIPIGQVDAREVSSMEDQIRAINSNHDLDPAELIRECLRRGAMSRVYYVEPGTKIPPSALSAKIRPPDPVERRREFVAYQASKSGPNQRCRCGSGKMYKNCCMKS